MSTEVATRWTPREVFAVARFRAYLLVYVFDVAADALWLITLGWVAAGAHNSVITGAVLAVGAIPHVIFSFHGGLHADRIGSGGVLRRTMPVRAGLLLVWAIVATVAIGPWRLLAVLAVTFAIGAVAGFHDPAMQKYPTEFLPRPARGTAVKLSRVSARFAQAVGALAGGWLLGHGGVSVASLVGAAVLVLTLVVLARLAHKSAPAAEQEEPPTSDATIGEGLDYVREHPVLRWTVLTQGVVNLVTAAAVMAMLPLKAHHEGWNAAAYGGSFGAYGLGITLGTAATLALGKMSSRSSVLLGVAGAAVSSASVIGIGVAQAETQTFIWAFIMGLAIGPVAPMLSGFAGEEAPGNLSGRVFSVIGIATAGIEPSGSLVTGVLAAFMSIDHVAELLGTLAAVTCLACLVGVWFARHELVLRADHV